MVVEEEGAPDRVVTDLPPVEGRLAEIWEDKPFYIDEAEESVCCTVEGGKWSPVGGGGRGI